MLDLIYCHFLGLHIRYDTKIDFFTVIFFFFHLSVIYLSISGAVLWTFWPIYVSLFLLRLKKKKTCSQGSIQIPFCELQSLKSVINSGNTCFPFNRNNLILILTWRHKKIVNESLTTIQTVAGIEVLANFFLCCSLGRSSPN